MLLLLMSIFLSASSSEHSDHNHFLDELMQDYNSNFTNVAGASVLISCSGQPIIHRSYGFANIEAQIPVRSSSNFRLASLTKQITATAILLLAEDDNGQLRLDDRIRSRWFPTLPSITDQITVRHLLTHTSGLVDYEELLGSMSNSDDQLSDNDVLVLLSRENRTYFSPPGLRYRYSNSGYALLALIVEQVSRQSFAQFLHQRIFSPLQMNNSVAFENGISTVTHRAFGYSFLNSSWIRTDQCLTSAVLGDGGVYSSIDDLARWDAALYDNRLLTQNSLQLAFAPTVRTDDPAIQYGFGWRISGDMLWHLGETIGFRNTILRFPRQGLTIVVLTNRNSPEVYQTALTIAHRFIFNNLCNRSLPCSSTKTNQWTLLVVLLVIADVVFYQRLLPEKK